MPAGMIVVDDDGDLARQRVRSRMANRAHHNFRFTMETVPEGEAGGIQKFMDNFDIAKPIEERVDPKFVTDYLLERFTIAGTPAECIAKVKRLEADGVKRILLTPPNADLRSSHGQVGQRSDSEILGNRHEATGIVGTRSKRKCHPLSSISYPRPYC